MISTVRTLYLSNRLFIIGGILVVLFSLSFVWGILFPLAQMLLVLALILTGVDILLLYQKSIKLQCERLTPNAMSLGNENTIELELENKSGQHLQLTLIDELPIQFQDRSFEQNLQLTAYDSQKISYSLRPLTRGEYIFEAVNVYAQSFLGLVERRFKFDRKTAVPVYPSLIEMKKYELYGSKRTSHFQGIKKIRKIGHSYEFEQIKEYAIGDDIRSINWKATGHHGKMMVNQYEDEKSQQVYSIIDKGRVMQMPFNGLSLLDHAINSSLVIANVSLQKQDKAGLLTFSKQMDTHLKAGNGRTQLRKILNSLYKEQPSESESNYELLFIALRKMIRQRSLVFLYTNFESLYALERVLPILRKINKLHLLVVMFFENTEISDYTGHKAQNVEEIYQTTIARKFVAEKQQIVQEIRRYGIQCILCKPEDLTIHVVNKYLELKARGMI